MPVTSTNTLIALPPPPPPPPSPPPHSFSFVCVFFRGGFVSFLNFSSLAWVNGCCCVTILLSFGVNLARKNLKSSHHSIVPMMGAWQPGRAWWLRRRC
ncbi:Beta-galactosidase [Psidium guajava]|nr:Beta-galactosidase [Psidium guajava]